MKWLQFDTFGVLFLSSFLSSCRLLLSLAITSFSLAIGAAWVSCLGVLASRVSGARHQSGSNVSWYCFLFRCPATGRLTDKDTVNSYTEKPRHPD